jgi:hypothetical protein
MHNKIIEKLDITNLSAVLVQEKDCIFKWTKNKKNVNFWNVI